MVRAEGVSRTGSATARASTQAGSRTALTAFAEAPVRGAAEVEARALVAGSLPDPEELDALEAASFALVEPDAATLAALLVDTPNVAELNATERTEAVGTLGALAPAAESERLAFSSQALLEIDVASLLETTVVNLGLFDPRAVDTGFDELRFEVEREGVVVVRQTFLTLAGALAYFDDNVVPLGDLSEISPDGVLDLAIRLELVDEGISDFDDGFRSSWLVTVPEPGSLWLVGLGLALLWRRPGRRPRVAPAAS